MVKVSHSIALLAAVTAGVVVACDSPFEPRGEGERVPVGRIVEDEIAGDTVRRYSFEADLGGEYAVFLEAQDGPVQLVVVDSARQQSVASLVASPTSRPLEENATLNFQTPDGGVYLLRVSAIPAGGDARFRFMVYRVNLAPEALPAGFALGDTVTGEAIDPIVDADEFVTLGQAGQEIVAVAEALGPAGSGAVSLVVVDPTTRNLLAYVFADAGTSTPLTTGRFRLPTSQNYRFAFRSVISNVYPRYRGPYRFWSYAINRAPEHLPVAAPIGTEVSGETIDRAGDVDEFTIQAAAGAEFNAFLQASRAFQLEVAPPTGPAVAAVTSTGADTGLFSRPTGRFRLSQAGTYVVRVTGTNSALRADTGAYRFFLYPVDRRPERVSATVALGDTIVGEAIDLPGDVDEFTFSAAAGQEFNVFFQALDGSPETRLRADAVDGDGTLLRAVESAGTDTSLLHQVTGRFAVRSTGTHRLVVKGAYDVFDRSAGPYRLFLYRVDRRPESLPDTLAFGDSLSGEALDLPGDVDEFRVTVRDSSGANLVAELGALAPEGTLLLVQLVDSATGQMRAGISTRDPGLRVQTGSLRLAPGTYTIRVDASHYQDRSLLRGPYRLWLYRFGFRPEVVRDTLAVGDTVRGEDIEPLGDQDVFRFYGARGQHVNIALQGLAAPSSGAFQAWISAPGDDYGPYAFVVSPTSSAALHDHQTMRLDLPATGWYRVAVTGVGTVFDRGPYHLAVEPLGSGPEHVGDALVVGDSVTTELIDTPGDWDEYTVTATPGQELGLIFNGAWDPPYVYILAFDRGTGDTLASNVSQGERVVGPFLVPASGQVAVAVREPAGFYRTCYDACGGIFSFVGPYRFRVIPINRAPESVPPAYVMGDTVRGEAIWPTADIDEFQSSGTPGDTLSPWFRLTADPVPQDGLITLEAVDPATGAVLVGSGWAVYRASAVHVSPGSFAVPPGGAYLIRVRAYGLFGTGIATAPYEFFVKRGP